MRATSRASTDRIAAVLHARPAVTDGSPGPPGASAAPIALELAGVQSGRLDSFDLRVRTGELVAVACTDPAVTDDLIDVVGRTTDPAAGSVLAAGLALPRWSLRDLRRTVLVSAHDAAWFSGSVRSSLGVRPDADARVLELALTASAADEVVSTLPDGLDSEIGDRGHGLSGGQRQRMVLARALAADPEILVLQEPTTAVDAVTEARIAARLRGARSGRTTIVLTTSPALLAVADRVVFVDEGRVVAAGTHPTLLITHAAYRELVTR
jgi:putative ABC transport system ATP-binding protein